MTTLMPRTRVCARLLNIDPLRTGVRRIVRAFAWLALAAACSWHATARAQSLLDMINALGTQGVFQFDALERDAAIANDTAFVKVRALCGLGPQNAAPTCTGTTLTLFKRLR